MVRQASRPGSGSGRVFGVRRSNAYLLLVLTSLVAPRAAVAVDPVAERDASFNATGVVTVPIGSVTGAARAVALQPDGKIVVAGTASNGSDDDLALMRLDTDGVQDAGFGFDGTALTDLAGRNDRAAALVVQPDGRLVVAGTSGDGSDREFVLVRYFPDGSLDGSFGAGGVAVTDFGATEDIAGALVLQSDGGLVVAGYRWNDTHMETEFALARYRGDGTPDSNFGVGGKVTTALGGTAGYPVALAPQPDGKVVLASGLHSDFIVVRYAADGSLDSTFNPGGATPGVAVTDFSGASEWASAVLVQPDGAIVAAGRSNSTLALARYTPDGSLDSSFGTNGRVTPGVSVNSVGAIALQPDGKILVTAGMWNQANTNNDFGLVRLTSAGLLDMAVAKDAIGNEDDIPAALAVDPAGRVLVAGLSNAGVNATTALARYTLAGGPWSLTPVPFHFDDKAPVAANSIQTSNMISISGVTADFNVPARVSGGEVAKNGSTVYGTALLWARTGDAFNVRHQAPADTTLTVGGLFPTNNLALTLGTVTSDTFTTVSKHRGHVDTGPMDPISLAILFVVAWYARRKAAV
jgi:uncharacterized delta-60 repeat protein